MKNYIKHTIVVVLLAIMGVAYAEPPQPWQVGDYWYDGGTTGNLNSRVGWKVYTGPGALQGWKTALSSGYPRLSDASPFGGNIYMEANTRVNITNDFVLNGTWTGGPGAILDIINGTTSDPTTLTVGQSGIMSVHEVDIETLGQLINYGDLTVNVVESSIASEFINHGITTMTSPDSKIWLRAGTSATTGGILDNYGTITLNGEVDTRNYATIISRATGTIVGSGRITTPDPGDATFRIANAGGRDEAFQLTGTHEVYECTYIYDGNTDQILGDIRIPIFKLIVESGHKLTLTKDLTIQGDRSILQGYPLVRVASGSTLDLKNHTITSDLDSDKGVSEFILESGATLIIGHEDGISSYSHPNGNGYRIGYGAIQTNSADYSSGANYHFDGDSYQDASSNRVQFSGCFFTDLDPTQHRVHDLIILNDRGLDLCPDFRPLEISGSVSPSANTDPNTEWGWVRGGETLPVTLSYFNAVFNGFDSVTMQWETQTETNNLGFYILRSTEPDATSATVISSMIAATNSSQGAVYSYKDDSLYDDGVYYYWLQDVSFAGEIELHGPAMAQVTLNGGGNHSPDIPLKTGFMRNYPNPFNPSTQLEYYLENDSDADFKVYNLKGQLVDQITLRNQPGGFHRYTWEPQLSSGVYLIKFTADGKSNTRRVMLSK